MNVARMTGALAPPGTPAHWSPAVGLTVAIASVGGAVAVAIAWMGAASSADVERQVPWGVVAAAGTVVFCGANLMWVVTARRAVASRLSTVVGRLGGSVGPATGRPVVSAGAGVFVAAKSMVRYHRPSCPLAAGKPVREASRTEHEHSGRRPCGVCNP